MSRKIKKATFDKNKGMDARASVAQVQVRFCLVHAPHKCERTVTLPETTRLAQLKSEAAQILRVSVDKAVLVSEEDGVLVEIAQAFPLFEKVDTTIFLSTKESWSFVNRLGGGLGAQIIRGDISAGRDVSVVNTVQVTLLGNNSNNNPVLHESLWDSLKEFYLSRSSVKVQEGGCSFDSEDASFQEPVVLVADGGTANDDGGDSGLAVLEEALFHPSSRRTALWASCGSGKSTVCQWILWHWAKGYGWPSRARAIFYIDVKRCCTVEQETLPLCELIFEHYRWVLPEIDGPKELHKHLRVLGSSALVIIDGLDHLHDECSFLHQLLDPAWGGYGSVRIFITAGLGVKRHVRSVGWQAFKLLGLSGAGVEKLLQKLIPEEDARTKLLEILHRHDVVEIVANPLLLQLASSWALNEESNDDVINVATFFETTTQRMIRRGLGMMDGENETKKNKKLIEKVMRLLEVGAASEVTVATCLCVGPCIATWTVEDVCAHFTKLGADAEVTERLRKARISGKILSDPETVKLLEEKFGVPYGVVHEHRGWMQRGRNAAAKSDALWACVLRCGIVFEASCWSSWGWLHKGFHDYFIARKTARCCSEVAAGDDDDDAAVALIGRISSIMQSAAAFAWKMALDLSPRSAQAILLVAALESAESGKELMQHMAGEAEENWWTKDARILRLCEKRRRAAAFRTLAECNQASCIAFAEMCLKLWTENHGDSPNILMDLVCILEKVRGTAGVANLAGRVLAKIEQVVGTDRRSMLYAAFLHRKGCYYWTFFRSSVKAVRMWQKARDAYIRLSGLTSFEVVVLTGRITFIWYLKGKFEDASTLLSGYFFDLPPQAFASVPFRFNWMRASESSSSTDSSAGAVGDNLHVALLFDFAQKLLLHVPPAHAFRLSDGCLRAIDSSHRAFEVVSVLRVGVLQMVGGQEDASPQQQFELYRRLLPQMKNTDSIFMVLGELGGVCCDLGRYEDSVNYYNMALDVERETPSAGLRAGLLFNMSLVFQKLRWHCKGLACCEECISLCGTLDVRPIYFVTLVQMRDAFHARCQSQFVCCICRTKSKWGCRDCPAMVECCSKFHCRTHECDRCCGGGLDVADMVEMLEEQMAEVEEEEDTENIDIWMQLDAMKL